MLSLAIWYMSISTTFDMVIGMGLTLLIVMGILGGLNGLYHFLESDDQVIPFKWVKVWGITTSIVLSVAVFVPTDPGHVAYLINSNVAIAEQEGRTVPKLNANEQSLINAMAVMYVTKRHERYIAANKESKKK